MSIVYLFALVAFCVLLLGVMFEAVVAVSRKPVWHSRPRTLALVETVDRREAQLPFVGRDRREPDEPEAAAAAAQQ